MRTRNAEYLQICELIKQMDVLRKFHGATDEILQPLYKQLREYLDERRIACAPTSARNRPSPRS